MLLYFGVLLLLCSTCESWNILFVHSFAGGSHQTVSCFTANLLASQNHTVTYASTNMPKTLHPSIKKIYLKELDNVMNPFLAGMVEKFQETGGKPSRLDMLLKIGPIVKKCCQLFYQNEEVLKLMNSNERFDMLGMFVIEICGLGLAHKLGIKNIVATAPSGITLPYMIEKMPMSAAVVMRKGPALEGFVENSMLARAKNVAMSNAFGIFFDLAVKYYYDPTVRETIPDYPGTKAMTNNLKLILMHHHVVIDKPYDFGPSLISLGGTLCLDYNPNNLPDNIHKFLENTNGFIIFSLGSHISTYTEEQQKILIAAFAELPYQVIWKSKTEIPNLPPNVMTLSWLPQAMLLQHPALKIFMTHGGYGSKVEGFCAGVPMIILPCFAGDQHTTAEQLTELGLGLKLDLQTMTSKEIISKVLEIDQGPYRAKMQNLQRQILMTRVTPEQVLGYIDIVINGGSLSAEKLMWWQYLYYDLILVPILVILAIRWLIKKT